MKIKSLIWTAALSIIGITVIKIETASAIVQNTIGRSYILPANPSISAAFLEDSNGDDIVDLFITQTPKPKFEFSIVTEQNGQLIVDLDSSSTVGFFSNAISSFAYIEDIEETSTRLKDDRENFLPSTQEEEVIQKNIPDISTSFLDGDLNVELVDSTTAFNLPGILYEFTFGEDFIQFLLPISSFPNDFNSFLAINDLSYIVNQNLFGQEEFIEELRLVESSFRVNAVAVNDTIFAGNQPESAIIFASEPVPESNNIISLLTLGLLATTLSKKYSILKF